MNIKLLGIIMHHLTHVFIHLLVNPEIANIVWNRRNKHTNYVRMKM